MVSPSQSTQKTKGEITGVIKRLSGINGVVLEEEQIIFTTICVELYHTKTRSWSYSYIPASRKRKTKMIIKTESNVEGWFYLTNPTSITRFTTQFDDHFDFDWLRPNQYHTIFANNHSAATPSRIEFTTIQPSIPHYGFSWFIQLPTLPFSPSCDTYRHKIASLQDYFLLSCYQTPPIVKFTVFISPSSNGNVNPELNWVYLDVVVVKQNSLSSNVTT